MTTQRTGRKSRRFVLKAGVALVAVVSSEVLGLRKAMAADALHAPWDRVLRSTVSPAGWVDYRKIRAKYSADLLGYLAKLASAPGRFANASEAKAFWLNAYNAICVQTLIDHDLPSEVPHSKLFGTNIFTEKRYAVAGKVRTLDEIEHAILRKKYRDNRIHAAVVCGASSCPRLRSEAFVAERLDKQLNEECRSWIGREKTKAGHRKNYLDRRKRTFFASKIFDWYDEDFGSSDAGILRFIARYSDRSQRQFLEDNEIELEFLSYDWSLNVGQPR